MADVNFDCPQCGQNLDAPEDMIGADIECPACENTITISDDSQLQEIPPETTENNKDATVKIDLPPEASMPKPHRRIVKIRRTDK